MDDREKIISEKVEEILEGVFRFPLKYIKTTHLLIFKSKSAYEKLYNQNENKINEYVPPLTYFVVSYFIFTTFSYLFWAIDELNNIRNDESETIKKDDLYNIIFEYLKSTNFDYFISYGFPVLFSFYCVTWLLSKFSLNKLEEKNLQNNLFYFLSSIPLIPAILISFPSIITGEAALHGNSDKIFVISFILFIFSVIFLFICGLIQLISIIKSCNSLKISSKTKKIVFCFLCFISLIIYSFFVFKTNEDLKNAILKVQKSQNIKDNF